MFSASETKIVSWDKHKDVKNLTIFVIQLKLAQPIKIIH